MNNIEILEKLIERCKECKFACCEQCEINNTQVRAIENLIQENKELKGKLQQYKKIEEITNKITDDDIKNAIENAEKEYIPKSKVKEKIEKLENSTSNDKIKAEIKELKEMKVDGEVFTTAVNFAIKELQSLLEKEE